MSQATLAPVTKRSAESTVTENLRNYILSGAVKPGTRLTEMALADHMGVARATVRTGLHRLAVEGIVVQIPYTGWQVAELSAQDVWELWTLRGSLEGLAAKLAAARMDDALRARIRQAADELRKACRDGDVQRANDCDFALHRSLIDAAGHGRLAAQYRLVEQQIAFYIASSNALLDDDLECLVGQHQPLIDALLAADPERAAAEAWRHNETEGRKLALWLSERGGEAAAQA